MEVLVGSTAYGDGTYRDNKRFNDYGVDSGMIGILPIALIELDGFMTEKIIQERRIGNIVVFEKDFECEIENGVFTFGDIIINTRDDEYED